MRIKVGVLAVVALVAFGLKRHYADATTDALSWILTPTAHVVGLVTGVAFAAVPGEGYFSAERMFLIEKACAGVNFMIAAFAMVAFALLHHARSFRGSAAVVGLSLLASYVAAIVVNAVRIVIAMWLAAHPVTRSSLTAGEIHRLEGIIVYFGGLVLLHELVRRADRVSVRHLALPLACYYAITLAVPFLNGSLRFRSGQAAQAGDVFLTHALVVFLVPLVLIGVVCAIFQIAQRVKAAVQLTTTVTGVAAAPSSPPSGRGMRNRWPSGDTA